VVAQRRGIDLADKLTSPLVAARRDLDLARPKRVLEHPALALDARERKATRLLLAEAKVEHALECEAESWHASGDRRVRRPADRDRGIG
jgi:hypothetical protein